MSDDFRLQLSVKIDGQHLLNIRAGSTLEFVELIKDTVTNAELLTTTCRALEGVQKPEPVRPSMGPNPNLLAAQKSTSPEYGPTVVEGVSMSTTKRDGTTMKSPRYTVKFAGGKSYSTFDGLVGQAANALSGKPAFYTIETKGDFKNLGSIRGAA